MNKEIGEVENISTITVYKMIQALYKYDYFSTKCFVDLLIEKRKEYNEIEQLMKIKELLFYQEDEVIKSLLEELICHEKRKCKIKNLPSH